MSDDQPIAEREAVVELLGLANQRNNTRELISKVLAILKRWTGCDAVGIRLREGEDFPYLETNGFPGHFVEQESRLCSRDSEGKLLCDSFGNPVLDCMCGNILQGRFDPAKPFFSPGGSFWSNCTTELLATTTEADRQARTRNRCNGAGYESVALIPLRAREETFGLMQMNDRQKGRFTPELIALLERLAGVVGLILWQRRAEEALRRTNEELGAANEELAATEEELRSQVDELLAGRKALDESERKYRNLVDNAPIGVYSSNLRGDILYANETTWRMFEFDSAEEMISSGAVAKYKNPKDREVLTEHLKRTGEIRDFEFEAITKNGKTRSILLSATLWEDVLTGMILDITERKRAEEAIKRYAADLRRSNEDLQQFAYVASHDLQEPLRAVASFTQLLAERYKGRLDKNADEFIAFAVGGANRMQTLINDLLAYSRLETRGKPPEPTDSHDALGQALANLGTAIEESGALVTNDDLPMVKADESQLVQLFQNLIGNAVKFRGPEPPRVNVSGVPKGEEWLFAVRDNGIGIAKEYQERIFAIFQRLHSREEYPGTGIGLAQCKRIVERHGGKIWVESGPDSGSTFFFTLPKT